MNIINQKGLDAASLADCEAAIATITATMEGKRLAAIEQIKKDVAAKYGSHIDVNALFRKPRKEMAPVPVKYRNPKTGEEWTGRGRAPKWIEGLTDAQRAKFLVAQPAQEKAAA